MLQAPADPSPDAVRADRSRSTRHRAWLVCSAGLRYRLGVASRAVAAIGGGYALSALSAAAVAVAFPGARLEASVGATLLAFVVYPCAVMWVFAARSAGRAWRGLMLPSLVLGAFVLAHVQGGAGA